MVVRRLIFLATALAFLMVPRLAGATYLTIRMPGFSDGSHKYYSELLATALAKEGHLAAIELAMDLPHLRIRDMMDEGTLSVHWLIRSETRDQRYLPVPVSLTNGLIGKRILLIPPEAKNDYKNVKTLRDFRELGKVGGFGTNWYDIGVWKANLLPYLEVANWRLIYSMTADGTRGIDYFSRGFNQVVDEAEQNPRLAIEPHLMLVYDHDFIFYVSPRHPELVDILTKALARARDEGIIDRLIKEHWARNYDILKPEGRTVIRLANPE